MPFVNIRILKGHSQERKDEISRRVTAAICEVAQLPNEAIWVVFEDVTADEFLVLQIRVLVEQFVEYNDVVTGAMSFVGEPATHVACSADHQDLGHGCLSPGATAPRNYQPDEPGAQ